LLGLAEWKAFGNSFSHGLATVMLQSVSAFLLDKASVGCATRGITSVTFAHAAEMVRRPGLRCLAATPPQWERELKL
ncbi:MAG: hypothetical protein ACREIE_07215, partial [Nitrospiraceae bacterium]